MTVRLLLGVAFVAYILVLVVCTDTAQSSNAVAKSNPVKCRRVKKCPKNEEFSYCPESIQRAQYCSEKAEPAESSAGKPCKEGCVCKENYLRAENGTCISADQCPITCGANEVLDNCPTDCQSEYCPTEEDTVFKPCAMPDVCPPPVCKCAFNYRRACNGSCIPTKECPPFKCRTNEEYNPCPPLCPTDDCSQASPTGECPPQFGHIGIILPCNPKCRCIKDYWRLDGICVPYGECPGVCPDNERYSTCVQAECRALNCTQKDQSVPCIRIDPTFCEKGCVCEEGYLRNKDGICVLEDECEPITPSCNSTNEEFVSCMQGVCRAKYCSQKGQDVPCPDIPEEECDSGCICKEYFLRAANGTCVPEDQCETLTPSCNSTNEEFVPCMQGVCRAKYCSQKGEDVSCPDISAEECDSGCICKEHFLRAANGTCVPEDQCETEVCPDNERYSSCVQAECRALNCTQKDQSVPCIRIDPTFCEKGCVCEEGYLRNKDGICVLEDECEPHSCPLNEEWSTCAQATCRPQNCSEKGLTVSCPLIAEGYCKEACVCQENYLRNENGDCVPEDECPPKTCGENEVLDNCSLTCNSDNCPQSADEEQVCTQSDPCVPACKCEFNYKRAENGTCIPTRDCPPFDCSAKPNEEYVACPPFCPTDECGKPRLESRCPYRIGTFLQCNPKCQCMDGYGRSNGTCVPFEKCPDLCPINEVYSPCVQQTCRPQNCSDRDITMKTCPTSDAASCQRGCVCQENYYRNDTGVCVSYEECGGHTCPLNEEWSTCAQATCRPQSCSEKGKTVPCPLIAEGYCEKACVCQENYLRNENGDCVPEDECPSITCGENEVLDNCSLTCNSDNCPQSADEEQVCTQSDPCVPACKCEFNYKRAENGTCIPTRDCPPFDCSAKPNEEFVACPPFCPTDECGKPRLEGRCPYRIGTFLQCNPKCQCMDGYGRSNGTCVPFEECPGLCPINEVYSPCVQQTCRPQNCSDRDVAMETCPTSDEACQRGCVCQENYYRNDTGVCVSYEECGGPKTCGENEVLEDCPMNCNSDNCPKSADEEQVCTQADPCVPACKCRFNYKRAENGTCIPTRDCPPFDCSAKPNEEFVACPPICPTDECGKPRLEGRCPFRIGIILKCKPKCQCIDGYGRSNGTCVPFEECPDLCPANEVYSPCVQQTCRPQNCSDRDLAMETCPTNDTASCERGCVCQENYYRNDKGVCISYEECGGPMCPYAHEMYIPNFKECPPNICKSLVSRYMCDENQKEGPGCICESGYLRKDLQSPCIPICDCPEMKDSPDC